jgi:hypothetical protein
VQVVDQPPTGCSTFVLSYPSCCQHPDFNASWVEACTVLHNQRKDYALIHDLSACPLSQFRHRVVTVLGDAKAIASRGFCKRVAIVFRGNYVMEKVGTTLLALS